MDQVVRPPIQPHESLWLTINFDAKDALLAGDALVSLASFVCKRDSDGADVTILLVEAGSPSVFGNKVTFLKKEGGGTDGENYKYTAIVRTKLGETLEEDLIMPIRET